MFQVEPLSNLNNSDILNAEEQTIVCTTNVVGAMGRGIALSVKKRYPHVYKCYRHHFESGMMTPNTLINVPIADNRYILLFPTKVHWRQPSTVTQIQYNLLKLASCYKALNIESLALPPLGMANGWLKTPDKKLVLECCYDALSNIDINCTMYCDATLMQELSLI